MALGPRCTPAHAHPRAHAHAQLAVLHRDALLEAVGLCAFELHKHMDTAALLSSHLLHLLRPPATDAQDEPLPPRIIRRRILWLLPWLRSGFSIIIAR